jgi:peptidoglycan/xylan/chitin deacetylase (PgdA/CDA1 family)
MDHRHYAFSPLPRRPKLAWPDSHRVALLVTLYLEHWEFQAPKDAVRDPRYVGEFGGYDPDFRSYTQREYGNRVGVFRVLDVLLKHRLPVTVALGAGAARRYPPLVEICHERGYEFAAHGSFATRMLHQKLDEATERREIGDAIAAVERATGARPSGWIGQDYGESTRTPALVAEAGLDWLMDWPNDDQPYWINPDKPIVSIPNHNEWDDVQLLWLRRIGMPRYPALIADAFERLWVDGAQSGMVMQIGLHPWLIGQAHRIRYLDQALGAIAGRRQVWRTTAGEVARWYKANGPAARCA